uniref:Uncharacterized protein n=1 Tax=Rhizophora mucronata TaxID=61149 RepID=A0A2P2M6Y6_RHIMU
MDGMQKRKEQQTHESQEWSCANGCLIFWLFVAPLHVFSFLCPPFLSFERRV